MTASTTTAANKKSSAEPGYDKTAQRILNLFFVLNSSPEPLTTEQIVLDSDLGYGSGNTDSDKRKFRRDREKLLERGIVIKEVRAPGSQETEESAWAVDRDHTFAAGGLITAEDADILMDAIDQMLAAGSSTFSTPLADIRSKIAYLTGEADVPETRALRSPMVDAVWSAFAERCALRFLYQNGRGEQRQRTVCVYGMFEREAFRISAVWMMHPVPLGHFAATASSAPGNLPAFTPSPATLTSMTSCSLSSILPTVTPSRPHSRFPPRRRQTWSTPLRKDAEASIAQTKDGHGPLVCAT